MRTNVVIDDQLMSGAMNLSHLKKAVIERSLQLLIQGKRQGGIRKLKGKLKWEGN